MRSLERRLPLAAGAVLALVVSVLTLSSYLIVRREQRQFAEERLGHVADDILGSLESIAGTLRAGATTLAEDPAIASYLINPAASTRSAAQHALEAGQTPNTTTVIVVSDLSGHPMLTSPVDADPFSWLPPPPAVDAPTIMPVLVGHEDATELGVTSPIALDGRRLGYVQQVTPISQTNAAAHKLLGAEGEIVLGSMGGQWTDLAGEVESSPPAFDVDGFAGYVREGERRFAVSRALQGTPWVLVLEVPEAGVLAPANRFLARIGAVALLLTLITAGVVLLLSRRMIGPLTELRRAADAIGSGDYQRRAPASGYVEFATVGAAFNRMAEQTGRQIEILRESEERFRLLVESVPDCSSYLLRPDGTVTSWHEGPGRATGYTQKEILGKHFCCSRGEHDVVESLPEKLLTDARDRGSVNTEAWIARKDGSRFLADVTLAATRDSQESLTGFVTLVRDLTDRKRSELLFRCAVDASPMGMLMVNEKSRITMVNPSLGRMFGYKEAEMIGLSVDNLVPRKSLAEHTRQREAYLKAPTARQIGVGRDLEGKRRDGTVFSVEIGLTPLTIDGKQFVLALVADVTEPKRLEKIGQDREARLQALMARANDGISVLNGEGTIQEANNSMLAILDRPLTDVVGHHIGEFQTEANREKNLREFVATVAAGGGHVRNVELVRPDGSFAVVDFSVSTVQVGDEWLVFSIGREITKERNLERQLLQAQKLESIGRLAGGIAHDFNNLLMVISGNAEIAEEQLESSHPSQEELREILQATQRAGGLTRQLLAFSRQQVLEPKVLNLSQLVIGMEKMLVRLIGEDIRLESRLNTRVSRVRADPGQLEQVIMNLVVNARDALEGGGTITIETSSVDVDAEYAAAHTDAVPGPYVMVSVTDDGMGMTPEVKARIFDPFFTTKEIGRGTGLGLATVYGIVKQSGGHIWVYSEPGKGTTIKVFLPLEVDADEAPAEVLPVKALGGSETVLVVEDDADVRRVTVGLLERRGYKVLAADGPRAALELVKTTPDWIHLLVTDVVMPDMSGPALATQFVASRPGLKVLYVSGYTDSTIARHGLTEGEAFLQKPFSGEALARKVRSMLDAPVPQSVGH
jgi:two-component system cell cycle sensor histidine kinase/response regulator CckA